MADQASASSPATKKGGGGFWSSLFGKRQSRLAGQHVFITGGSEGLGLEMARQLVEGGSKVTIVSRSKAKLDAAVKSIQESAAAAGEPTTNIFATPCDVGSDKDVKAAVAAGVARFGPVDVLICNAGIAIPGLFLEQTPEVAQCTFDLNYIGVLRTLYAVLPAMVARGSGQVVLVASAAALVGFAGYSLYAPTKWALRGLGDCLRNELHGTGVEVCMAYPPDMKTPGYERENETKPRITHDIDAALGACLLEPGVVARATIRGIERRRYHLPTPDLGQEALVEGRVGMTPSPYWLPLRMLAAPILVLVMWVLTKVMDGVAFKANAAARKAREQQQAGGASASKK